MKYQVGQVVYLLNSNDLKIFPARIEEEVIRRRSTGEETNYKVMLPNKSKDVVDLSDLDATVFTSETSLREHMIENAIKTIDTLIERANRVSAALSPRNDDPVRDEEDVVES